MHKIRKIFLFLIVFFQIFALNVSSALAIHIPSADEIATDLEQRYHLDPRSLKSYGESSNVAEDKKVAPQIMVSFSPTDPNIGEEITATVFPMYFQNPKEQLYYTWYLKHPECVESRRGGAKFVKKCDLNNDDKVNVNDWKIEAMRIITAGGYDYNRSLGKDSANCYGTNQPDYCTLENAYTKDQYINDNDGYSAIPGGNDRKDMPVHCYIHDFEKGIDFELIKKLPGSTSISCADLGDGIIRVPTCVNTSEEANDDGTNSSSCIKSDTDPSCYGTNVSCPSGETIQCVDSAVVNDDPIANTACSAVATGSGNPFSSSVTCATSQGGAPDYDFICDDKNRRHLFPYPEDGHPKDTGDGEFGRKEEKFWRTNPEDPDTANNGNKDEANVTGLGQDKFSWNYAPGDKVGVVVEGSSVTATKYDDASMMIEWALTKNKCAIESSDEDNYAPYIRKYNVKIPVTAITDDPNGQDSCIDGNCINDCLADNLLDPREGGQSSKLDVSLSYVPENPINDSSGAKEGDELSVHASVAGTKAQSYAKYIWEVYTADEVNPEDWGPPLIKSSLPGVKQTTGIGLDTLKFKLGFSEPVPKFLKVKVNVSENIDEGITNEGHSEVIIPLYSSSSKIHVFPVTASSDLVLSLGAAERCTTGLDKALCPAVQNEVIGLSVAEGAFKNFLWTVNGEPIKPLSYPSGGSCLSRECDSVTGAGTNIAFFPVLNEKGARYNVSLTADNIEGKKVTLSRTLEVEDPEVKIVSADSGTCQPVLLGNYVDLDNKPWPDYSETNFQAAPGSTISLQPIVNNPFTKDLLWFIDGQEMSGSNIDAFDASISDDGTLTFPADKNLGEVYTVAVASLYAQDNNIKKFLNFNNGIQFSDFYESTVSDSIDIQMADLSGSSSANVSAPRKFLAAIFTGLPAYISFLFRIVLTVALILAVSWITMSLTPRTQEE
jgi:hypothetical protein